MNITRIILAATMTIILLVLVVATLYSAFSGSNDVERINIMKHTPTITPNITSTPSPTPTTTAVPTPTPSAMPIEQWSIERMTLDESGNYRDAMRWWVIDIAMKARERDDDFIMIPQNCTGLFPPLGDTDMNLENLFLNTISGVGNESLVYGLGGYGSLNEDIEINAKTFALSPALSHNKPVLSIDYCKSDEDVLNSININSSNGYLGYQSARLELNSIPDIPIVNENANNIYTLDDAMNFIILLNPQKYHSRTAYIEAFASTNYDVIVIDAFFNDGNILTSEEVNALKTKANGGSRLVISYLSIGEAEDYRYYWQRDYRRNPPEWLMDENPNWAGNYPVRYWYSDWQDIIALGDSSYLDMIIDAGFDGAYLDIVDGYQHFEHRD